MELADFSLADYIESVFHIKPLSSVGSQIAKGLEFVHQSDYVHRDLKPANDTKLLHVILLILVLYCKN